MQNTLHETDAAPGPGGIPTTVYKIRMLERLLPITAEERPPAEWFVSSIVQMQKQRDLTKASNYQGISLMSTVANL